MVFNDRSLEKFPTTATACRGQVDTRRFPAMKYPIDRGACCQSDPKDPMTFAYLPSASKVGFSYTSSSAGYRNPETPDCLASAHKILSPAGRFVVVIA